MKIYFDQDKKNSHFDRLKQALWEGDFKLMTDLIQQGIKGVNLDEFNPFKYFKKQQTRIGYQKLRDKKQPCGSGIIVPIAIGTGIRRIINLRFIPIAIGTPSSFWYPENVENSSL